MAGNNYNNRYSPNSVERFNQTLKKSIRALQSNYDDKTYLDALDSLVENYNNCRHSMVVRLTSLITSGFTPMQVYNGDEEILEEALRRSKEYRLKRIYKGSTQPDNIEVGTVVRVSKRSRPEDRKIHQRSGKGYLQNWGGLFKVTGQISS